MELRRVDELPPYALATIRELTLQLRRAGEDVIDLGFGNPDLPSPEVAVEKLAGGGGQPAQPPLLHVSAGSRSCASACAELYQRRFGVELDPETEIVTTIGAKEGFSHLMLTLLEPGDAALVPTPVYPIHIHGPDPRGRRRAPRADGPGPGPLREPRRGVRAGVAAAARDRALVPAQPDDRDASTSTSWSASSHSRASTRSLVVHDFAYADLGFDGYQPPSILQVPGAKRRRGRAVHADEVVLDGRLARRIPRRQRGDRRRRSRGSSRISTTARSSRSRSRRSRRMNEAPDTPTEVNEIYRGRRDALIDGLARIGWHIQRPEATMFVWAPLPDRTADLDSLEFAELLAREAHVAVSPGSGFGPGGEGMCASRSSRTSTASAKRSAASERCSVESRRRRRGR